MRDRSAFLYMEPSPDTPEFAQCGTCTHFIPDTGRCFLFSDKDNVDADDSCGLYVQGEPQGGREPSGSVDPDVAGFYKGNVRCENCVSLSGETCGLFKKLNRFMPGVWNLDELVKPRACCNAFEGERSDPAPKKPDDNRERGGMSRAVVAKAALFGR